MLKESENIGFILVNKPSGPTSHDIVDHLRRITGVKKIGHAGTLDPFATGLLILGIGRPATKLLGKFLKQAKEYIATIKLGAVSDTYDRTGEILQITNGKLQITKETIEKTLKNFVGEIEQIPPMYSAKKVKGKKLYQLARQGKSIARQPQKVTVYKIKLLKFSKSTLKIKVGCSSGTYIRSLADDIGRTLGHGAYLEELCRTKIGQFDLENAVDLNKINSVNWRQSLIGLDMATPHQISLHFIRGKLLQK
jgi:tRNA pseudouridine55 synthase